ncbi:hypothetical protein PUN28_002518 [Cardiocondyla obscurior]|uniref:Uncharacterized protein n=1 Tax=Cardiocondyla obscurior TaxID=286306 RepID=A0AAW2GUQ2_9HYME
MRTFVEFSEKNSATLSSCASLASEIEGKLLSASIRECRADFSAGVRDSFVIQANARGCGLSALRASFRLASRHVQRRPFIHNAFLKPREERVTRIPIFKAARSRSSWSRQRSLAYYAGSSSSGVYYLWRAARSSFSS